MLRGLGIVALTCVTCLNVGCASPWEGNFVSNPEVDPRSFSPVDSVEVRRVEFERLQRYAASEKQRRIDSTTAPADLPEEDRTAAKNRLLETLQLRERGDQIELLGWSEFTDVQRLEPEDPRLEKFAKKIGADVVVVASEYAGKVQRTVDRPMTTYSSGYTTVGPGRRGRGPRVVSYSDTSTTWVPMNVIEDQYFYTAAFLRRTQPGNGQ
jgi:hypothetical protein